MLLVKYFTMFIYVCVCLCIYMHTKYVNFSENLFSRLGIANACQLIYCDNTQLSKNCLEFFSNVSFKNKILK